MSGSRPTPGPGCNAYSNMFHHERVETFIAGDWPYRSSWLNLCNPHQLALAGLEYYTLEEARCVVCLSFVKNLQATSDPWIEHAKANPDCPLILLGKRNKSDDYTIGDLLQFVAAREINVLDLEFEEKKCEAAKRFVRMFKTD